MSEQVEAELQKAFATETTVEIDAPGASADPFQPAPSNLRTIMAMQDVKVKAAWLKSYKKELKTLVESGTFSIEPMQAGDTCTPTMDDNRVKLQCDGSLDKLKTRIVVRGDLQTKSIVEDTHSPTAFFPSFKLIVESQLD